MGGVAGGAASGAAAGTSVMPGWGTLAGAGIGMLSSIFGGQKQDAAARVAQAQQQAQYIVGSAQAQAQNLLAQNNAVVQNKLMGANNVLAGANESVGLYVQSLNNQRSRKATGDAFNQLQETVGRYSDDYARGNFQNRIAAAEMLGRTTAELAGAGIGGTTSQLINRTMRLQQGQAEEEMRIGNRTAMWDFAKQRAGLTDQLLDASSSLIQRDMSGYQYGDAYAQSVVGPMKPVGSGSVGNSGIIGGILGGLVNTNWANVGQAAGNIYKSFRNS